MTRFGSFLQPGVKVAAAGLGAVVAGPLGAALGGVLGDALGGASSKLINDYADKFGDKAAEKLLEQSEDALIERLKAEAPTLEAAHRAALQMSLKAVRAKAGGEYSDWFENWDRCLGAEETLRLAGVEEARLTPESVDRLFDRVLIRIDAQGAAMLRASTSLQLVERPAPQALLASLRETLPERFEESFKALIVSEKYEAAWREMQLACGERLETLVRSVKDDTAALRAGMEELLRRTADRAVEEGRLTEAERRAETAEAASAEWKRKFLEAVQQSQNPSIAELLRAGDLDAAVDRKREQIDRQGEEQARSYFELGQIEELRFDYAKATDAYGEAWRLKADPKYGFSYAYSAQRQRRFVEAIQVYEILRDSYKEPSDVAATLNNLGNLYRDLQRFEDAEKAYDEALEKRRELASRNREAYLPDMARTLNNMGNLYRDLQRFEDAEKAYDEALEKHRELASRNREAYLPDVARTLNNLGNLYGDIQRFEDAEKAYDEALEKYRELASRNREAYLPDVAMTLNNLGVLYRDVQRFEDAEKACDEALEKYRELASRNREAYLPDVAATLNNLGVLYRAVQRFEDAEEAYDEALEKRRELASRNRAAYLPDVATTLNNLGNLYRDLQRFEDAEKAYDEALEKRRELASRNQEAYLPDVATTLNDLGILYSAVQRFEDAEKACDEAEKLFTPFWMRSREAHGDQMARILSWRAVLSAQKGNDSKEACDLARRAMEAARSPVLKATLESFIAENCDGL